MSIPAFFRYLLLFLFILPFRSFKSAKAYKSVWMKEGSPLLVHSKNLHAKVEQIVKQKNSNNLVSLGMRYGNPSVLSSVKPLLEAKVDKIVVMPLFPQYSSAATGSAIQKTLEVLNRTWNMPSLEIISSFYNHPAFISAQLKPISELWNTGKYDYILFSYHGLPLEHLQRNEHHSTPCEVSGKCCFVQTDSNKSCYRRQCIETTRLLTEKLGISEKQHSVSFQSRLGRAVWILPNTEVVLPELKKQGFKNILVACPSFVSDCLETVEEIGDRAAEQWHELGGESLTLVSCMNSSNEWANAVVEIAGI